MRISIMLISIALTSCAMLNHDKVIRPVISSETIIACQMNVLKVPVGTAKFSVSKRRPANADIYINSNFFDRRGPIGELIIAGKRTSSRTKGGGYFFVRNGTAGVSAYTAPTNPSYSTQSILVGINDGKVNSKLFKRSHAKERDYRSLVGTNSAGDLYFIASSRTCLVTIREIVNLGKHLGIQEAILPDAGSSVDYQFSDGVNEVSMKALPAIVKIGLKIEEPKSYIVGSIQR